MENHGSYDKDSLFILTAADRRHRTWICAFSLETDDQLVHGKRIRNANVAPELKMRTE